MARLKVVMSVPLKGDCLEWRKAHLRAVGLGQKKEWRLGMSWAHWTVRMKAAERALNSVPQSAQSMGSEKARSLDY